MIFNFWRPYRFFKPKKDGWYQCTVNDGFQDGRPRVMDLHYDTITGRWVDLRRQRVFEGYKVYKQCRAAIEDNRVYSDSECVWIDILAWRKLPKCYKRLMRRCNNV